MRYDGGLLRHYNILKQRITTHYASVFLRFIDISVRITSHRKSINCTPSYGYIYRLKGFTT